MPSYKFRYFFAELDEARRYCEIDTWGGHLGTALSRSWKELRRKPAYKDIKNLRPTTIDLAPAESKKTRRRT